MMLTAEQRTAIQKAIDSIAGDRVDDPMQYPELLALLRDLLTSSKPAWEITEERKKALRVAVGDMDLSENIHYLGVIRNMLEEAE